MTEVADDREDINKNQGGRCCLGKSSREGEKKKRKVAVDKRKTATGGGEREKNVHEKKRKPREKERTNEEREKELERFVETFWGRFRRGLRSSWGPVAKKSYRWRR
jgi:hypothetical protein